MSASQHWAGRVVVDVAGWCGCWLVVCTQRTLNYSQPNNLPTQPKQPVTNAHPTHPLTPTTTNTASGARPTTQTTMHQPTHNPPAHTHHRQHSSWGQADRVAAFLEQPARPRQGMPSKPIVGTAVSIQLDLPPHIIADFFGQGGA